MKRVKSPQEEWRRGEISAGVSGVQRMVLEPVYREPKRPWRRFQADLRSFSMSLSEWSGDISAVAMVTSSLQHSELRL